MDAHRSPAESTTSQSAQLERIAVAAVRLGALGPRLAELACEMTAQARDQAVRAQHVAESMHALTEQLEQATGQLRGSSAQVESALAIVSRIADHTKILAINASIEASRAGVHGRAFGIVVEEVQRLADNTGQTTGEIEARVQDMHASIARVAAMTGADADTLARSAAGAKTSTVGSANLQIRAIADSASRQITSVELLNRMGGDVKSGTDALLLALGTFRFVAHRRAEREVAALVGDLVAADLDRRRLEVSLIRWIERHPHFELVYLTDARGRQIVDNIVCDGRRARQDHGGHGRDWSNRPWYRHAVNAADVCATDIYRSSATGDFCFTVSAAVRGPRSEVRAVVAADVNFQQILAR